jgi:hypothetical protein
MSKEPIKFSPACTGFDREAFIATRIRQLRESLEDKTYARQKDNITLAIKLYASGDLPLPDGESAWFLNGKFCGKRLPVEYPDGSVVLAEVCFTSLYIIPINLHDVQGVYHQMMQRVQTLERVTHYGSVSDSAVGHTNADGTELLVPVPRQYAFGTACVTPKMNSC